MEATNAWLMEQKAWYLTGGATCIGITAAAVMHRLCSGTADISVLQAVMPGGLRRTHHATSNVQCPHHCALLASFVAAVAAYHTLYAMQQLPAFLPALVILPMEPFQLTSFALSLLLVFRTNSSYGRWYEGRRRFGRITTTCRNVCRQVRAGDCTLSV